MSSAIVITATLDEAGATMVGTAVEVSARRRKDGAPELWRRYPLWSVPLAPDFREAAEWLTSVGGRTHLDGFGLHLPGRVAQVLVDVSHRLYGMPFLEALWNSSGRRKWHPRFRGVVEVEADLILPEAAGPRLKIGRGALISALAQATRTGLLTFRRSEAELVREWESYNRGTVAGEKLAPPRVQALKLAAWGATILHRQMMANRPEGREG